MASLKATVESVHAGTGVVEVAGVIRAGDEVVVCPYAPPRWLERSSS